MQLLSEIHADPSDAVPTLVCFDLTHHSPLPVEEMCFFFPRQPTLDAQTYVETLHEGNVSTNRQLQAM